MNIVIAGGSGFLGRALTEQLINQFDDNICVTWLSSRPQQHSHQSVKVLAYDELEQNLACDVLINLAGTGIADKPWSDKRKELLMSSRIDTTQKLVTWIRTLEKPPLFISGSAIGWYGVQGDKALTEASAPVIEFQHRLCDEWEKMALQAANFTTVIIVRTGVVLHKSGGMLKKVLTPFKCGLGGKLGSGQQILSWISLTDWINAVIFLINHHQNQHENQHNQHIYNLTAPNPVSNATFTQTLAKTVNRPAFFHAPAFILKLALGEMSTLLLNGQKVLPKQLLDIGFTFSHEQLALAING